MVRLMTVELLRAVLAALVVASAGLTTEPKDLQGDTVPIWTDVASPDAPLTRVRLDLADAAVTRIEVGSQAVVVVDAPVAASTPPSTDRDVLAVAPKTSPPAG